MTVDVGAAASGGWCVHVEVAATETMTGNCFIGRRNCLHGRGDNLVLLVRRDIITINPSQRCRYIFYVGAAMVYEMLICHVQFGLWVAKSCGVVGQVRVVLHWDDSRRCGVGVQLEAWCRS
jgi:hypothetical protein